MSKLKFSTPSGWYSKKVKMALTRHETEVLLHIVREHQDLVTNKISKAPEGFNQSAWTLAVRNLINKSWSVWADAHPEEGPFQ